MIQLEPAMIYRLDVKGPLQGSDGSEPDPRRQFWQMRHATLSGPRIEASTPMPGIDWFTPSPGKFGRPHVRLPFLTHDGALILLDYQGIVEASDAFVKAVEENGSTQWEDQYMRMALYFETSSPKYQWLTQRLFLARGRLVASKSIEYDVYQVN